VLRGRLLRVMRTVDMIANTTAEDAIKRQMMRVFSVVVVVLVISTGFVQYLANEMAGENWIGIKTRCSFPDADVCGGLCTPAASANANGCITIKRFGEPSLYSCTFLAGGCHPNPNPNPNPDPGPEDGSATRPRAGPRKSKTPTAATRWTSMSRSTSPSSRSPRSGNAASLSPLAPPRARAPQLGARRYGDITPVSALSKMVMIVLVCFTAYAIPNQVLPAPALSRQRRPAARARARRSRRAAAAPPAQLQKLQALRELRSEYDGVFAHTPGRPFVILCCSPDVDVRPFVAEFFHEDHATKRSSPQLVLLINTFPSQKIRQLLLKVRLRPAQSSSKVSGGCCVLLRSPRPAAPLGESTPRGR
jgi:hypothetical protein